MRELVGERLCRELDKEAPADGPQDCNPYLDDHHVRMGVSDRGVDRAIAAVAAEIGVAEKPRFEMSRDFNGPIVSIPEFAISLQRDTYERRWILRGRMKQTELDAMFSVLNREFFQGQLPSYRVRWSKRARSHAPMLLDAGRIRPDRQRIELSTALRTEAAVRRALLHAMCHQGSAAHGRRFRARLRKIANHGERWARDQEEYYHRMEVTWNAAMTDIRRAMDRALDPSRGRKPTLHTFVSRTAKGMDISRQSLLRLAPWIPAAWRKAKKRSRRAAIGTSATHSGL